MMQMGWKGQEHFPSVQQVLQLLVPHGFSRQPNCHTRIHKSQPYREHKLLFLEGTQMQLSLHQMHFEPHHSRQRE